MKRVVVPLAVAVVLALTGVSATPAKAAAVRCGGNTPLSASSCTADFVVTDADALPYIDVASTALTGTVTATERTSTGWFSLVCDYTAHVQGPQCGYWGSGYLVAGQPAQLTGHVSVDFIGCWSVTTSDAYGAANPCEGSLP